jgi:hypothetical protein
MRLKNRPAVTKNVEIIVNASNEEFIAYIDGPDQLRLDRYGTYKLVCDNGAINDDNVTMQVKEIPDSKKQIKDYCTFK